MYWRGAGFHPWFQANSRRRKEQNCIGTNRTLASRFSLGSDPGGAAEEFKRAGRIDNSEDRRLIRRRGARRRLAPLPGVGYSCDGSFPSSDDVSVARRAPISVPIHLAIPKE
jgi:hypothetical protein